MDETPLGFAELIAPLSPEAFFRDYWEQRPLIQQGVAGREFSRLFSVEAVDRILAETDLAYPSLSLARDGARLPKTAYHASSQRPTIIKDRAHPSKVLHHYRQGATIQLMLLERTWLPVGRVCRQLEEELGCLVEAGAFLSPPNPDPAHAHQALAVHYDVHDMFVLQIWGTKRWRIYDAPFPLPLTDQEHTKLGVTPTECLREVVLEPGDAVYLPRGTFHEAVALGEHSLHLCLEVQVFRWMDALRAALRSLGNDVRFRKAVPVRGLTEGEFAAFSEAFEQIKALALEEMSAAAAAGGLRQAFRDLRHPIVDGQLAAWVRAQDERSAEAIAEHGQPQDRKPVDPLDG